MKPTRLQHVFADERPALLWFVVVPMLVTWGSLADTRMADLQNWRGILATIGLGIVGFLAGLFIAAAAGWMVLGPLDYSRGLKNGGPFEVGDEVMVLSHSHRGKIARIYSTWQHDTVRVDLGPEAKESFKDIFGASALLRVSARAARAPAKE
jgi:uncharacterized membrane protein YeaQ/YmgE (transglycosylase-associated protein family)